MAHASPLLTSDFSLPRRSLGEGGTSEMDPRFTDRARRPGDASIGFGWIGVDRVFVLSGLNVDSLSPTLIASSLSLSPFQPLLRNKPTTPTTQCKQVPVEQLPCSYS
jgi:hypothetical protein